MAKISYYDVAFNTGELSPRLATRTDFAKFRSGVETFENLIALPEGGAMRRSGSRYVAEVRDSAVKGRLRAFQYSTTQAYMLEFGAMALQFYKDQGKITIAATDAAINNGTFDSDISGWTDLSNGTGAIAHDPVADDMELQAAGSGNEAIAEQSVTTTNTDVEHVIRFQVKGSPEDSVTFRIGSSSGAQDYFEDFVAMVGWHSLAFTPTASPFYIQFENSSSKTLSIDSVTFINNAPMELTTPWPESTLFKISGPQSADVLYLFHKSYPTYKLERRGHTTWSLVQVLWEDGPYLSQNNQGTTLTPAAATGLAITITASDTVGINNGDGFKSTDVGRLIRYTDSSTINWGWGIIVEFVDALNVKVDIKRTFTTTTAQTTWKIGSWSGTTGYPSTGTFFEQRLYCAGSTKQPQTFWASQTADYQNHMPDSDPTAGTFDGTVEDNDALDYTMAADNVNAIVWMNAGQDSLTIGTEGGEWIPSSTGSVITPSDAVVKRQTTHGSSDANALRIGSVVLFVQKAKRKILEFAYTFESDGFEAFDMTRLSQHVTYGGIEQMAYQQEPDSQVWTVRSDGQMPNMTYRRQEDVVGWGRAILGGSFNGGNAVVESVDTIPGNNGTGQVQDSTSRDEVWIIVKRTINGATKRYVEVFERDFETGHAQADAYYSDSIITYDGTAVSTITGLDHLEGEVVKVWADGALHADKTVSGGSITLDISASTVQVGLGYTHILKTLKMEGGNPAGTSVGKTKRIYGVTFVLLNSHTLKYGPDADNLVSVDFRNVEDAMDAGVPFFSGEHYESFEGNWAADSRIYIASDDPAPFTLLAMAPDISINATTEGGTRSSRIR